ncbi:hypothetical protein ACOCJ4_00585 [Knoellia sp. CPCC 206435]|uniref:hypothetical protein n=1 Tax=Knoellia terrae TaxID=3404797 RepID=UPI003B4361DC
MATLDPILLDLAASQLGMLTTSQAMRAGMDKASLTRSVRDKVLLHPFHAMYAVPSLVDRSSPAAWHRHLAQGARLLYPDLVLTGVTAVLAHGLDVWGCDLARPAILRPIARSTGVRGIRVRPLRGDAVDTSWGPALSPAQALVQLALDHGIEPGVVSADHALRRGLCTATDLEAALALVDRWPGAHKPRSMTSLTCARRESVGESRCGVAMAMAGIRAVPQVEVRDERGVLVARVDWRVEGTTVVVEFDGKVKFADGDPATLWAEKKREDRLRALGYTVVRITWADLERPGAVAAKIRAGLDAATAA